VALSAAALTACSDDSEETPTLTAVTYNGGLAVGFVSGANERVPLTAEAVAGLDADVICVQEFWLPDHVTALQEAAADTYPHSVFVDPDPGMTTSAACMADDTADLLQCIEDNGCDEVCADDLVNCALLNCGDEVNALPEDCYSCVGANIGADLDTIIDTCQGESSEFLYQGGFGIGLLSKHPISSSDVTVFDSHLNRRGLLHAQLDTPAGEVHAYCTHLSAVFGDDNGDGMPDIPFPEAGGSWEEEQAAQIEELISQVASQAAGKQVMVLGDFNTGVAGPGYEAEIPENYQLLADDGWANPYLDTPSHTCTFCADNPIIAAGNADDETSAVIDHVLLKGFSGAAVGSRVLDQEIEITVCEETKTSAYSDHYGVSVDIEY
jgi:endonuclease/exonuclease/phosphatase family metal-dependent hydrolase